MANAKSGTLVADAATGVTVAASQYGVWVHNRATDGTEMWARFDGEAAEVAGDDSFLVAGSRNFPTRDATAVTVSLISAGTPDYSVDGSVPVTY